jgi:hypothetical protein
MLALQSVLFLSSDIGGSMAAQRIRITLAFKT